MKSSKYKILEKYVKRWKKIYQTPVCLAQGDCNNNIIIRSHTISKARSLTHIAEKNHVLVRQVNLFANSEKELLNINQLSINDALTFKGFCNKHDRNLFQSLDKSEFIATPEQLFMQAYRCVCREVYFKACQVKVSLNAEQIAELQELPSDNNYKLSQEMELFEQAKLKGLDDILKCKEKFESLLKHSEFIRIRSYVIYVDTFPVFACAGSFMPECLSNGEELQDYSDFDSNLQSLFFSVIPVESGMFFILSFFDDEAKTPIRFIEDLIATNNLSHRLIWLSTTHIENLAFKPSWWNGLRDDTRSEINKAVNYNSDLDDSRVSTFNSMPNLKVDKWNIQYKFWI